MKSLERGLAVIESFDETRRRQTVAEVSAVTGMDRAGARRVLLALVSAGYARPDGKAFVLAPRVARLGGAFLRSSGFNDVLQPVVDRLSREAGESCAASVLDGAWVRIVAHATGTGFLTIQERIGSIVPAYCSSMGRVLLAGLTPDQRQEIVATSACPARTPFTPTDPIEIEARIAAAEREGFAKIEQELEVGLRSIAVPVFDTNGRRVAAINIASQCTKVPIEVLLGDHLDRLREAQDSLRRLIF